MLLFLLFFFATWPGGGLDESPGRVWPPACNQVTLMRFEAVSQQAVQGRAEALQHQPAQGGIYGAVPR